MRPVMDIDTLSCMATVFTVWFNCARRKLGFGYWSLTTCLKNQVKEAVKYIGNYGQAVIHEAQEHQLNGVICGHIHRAVIADFDGITDAGCADWVESCTTLAEQSDGSQQLIRWADESIQRLDKHATTNAHSDSDKRMVSTS